MFLQFFLLLFLLFAVSRVLLQLRQRNLTVGNFLFWGGVFIAAMIGVLEPELTSQVAKVLGIGRGADVVVYFSIVILFYLIFRITIAIEELRSEITYLIRELALKNNTKNDKKRKKT